MGALAPFPGLRWPHALPRAPSISGNAFGGPSRRRGAGEMPVDRRRAFRGDAAACAVPRGSSCCFRVALSGPRALGPAHGGATEGGVADDRVGRDPGARTILSVPGRFRGSGVDRSLAASTPTVAPVPPRVMQDPGRTGRLPPHRRGRRRGPGFGWRGRRMTSTSWTCRRGERRRLRGSRTATRPLRRFAPGPPPSFRAGPRQVVPDRSYTV